MRNIWPSPHVWWVPDGALPGLERSSLRAGICQMQLTLIALLLPIFNKSLSHKAVRNLHNAAADLFNRHILLAHVNGIDFRLEIWCRVSSVYCLAVVRCYFVLLTTHNCCVVVWKTHVLQFEGAYRRHCWMSLFLTLWQSDPIRHSDFDWDFGHDKDMKKPK